MNAVLEVVCFLSGLLFAWPLGRWLSKRKQQNGGKLSGISHSIEPDKIYRNSRTHRAYDYRVSHDGFLLRGGSDDSSYKNIDIEFVNVFYLEIPTMFRGIVIEEIKMTPELIATFPELTDSETTGRLFRLTTEGRYYFVGAYGFSIHYNNLEHYESSLRMRDENAKRIYPGPGRRS
jgi:hypothetical protein